jgi:hypothetical protein
LVDTFRKDRGTIFDHWPADRLATFICQVRSHGIAVVLAGSLGRDLIDTAVALVPDLIAVRTAACTGGRQGAIAARRVRTLQELIAVATARTRNPAKKNRPASGAHFARPRPPLVRPHSGKEFP